MTITLTLDNDLQISVVNNALTLLSAQYATMPPSVDGVQPLYAAVRAVQGKMNVSRHTGLVELQAQTAALVGGG